EECAAIAVDVVIAPFAPAAARRRNPIRGPEARRDGLGRAPIDSLDGPVGDALDVVTKRRLSATVTPVAHHVGGDEMVLEEAVAVAVLAEVGRADKDVVVDDRRVGTVEAERRPADVVVAPVPVDPRRTPDASRNPRPTADPGEHDPASVVERPAERLV